MYYVTMWRVRITTVTVKKPDVLQIMSVYLCILSLVICMQAHASYYIAICGLSGYTLLFHIISPKTARFSESITECKIRVFEFL